MDWYNRFRYNKKLFFGISNVKGCKFERPELLLFKDKVKILLVTQNWSIGGLER